uniref:Uncharacterized protein n=1 Tax=Paramoeba aestuarina TaxID=180227 RepID=A0A7S4KVW7_9EUKA|mmetsp:Transcript_26619/g.41475  ORF Transcript_26619/g.41475 Transcript_26619/m.41475 type:complete len:101 (+) Transcript_26619:1390-1692(+)
MSKNKLSGSLSLNFQAESLVQLYLHKNSFSGDLDLTQAPEKLEILWLNGNSFDGTLHVQSVYQSLKRLKVKKNNDWKEIRADGEPVVDSLACDGRLRWIE